LFPLERELEERSLQT